MRRPIKAHLIVKPAGIPVQTGYTCDFKFGFEFKPAGKPVKPTGKPVGIPVRTG